VDPIIAAGVPAPVVFSGGKAYLKTPDGLKELVLKP
jgi:hypothetical protein